MTGGEGQDQPSIPGDAPVDAAVRLRRSLEGILGVPATEGNELQILRNGDRIFPAMLDAIRGATRTVDFLTFVYWKGRVGSEMADALAERAAAGVRVRVLLDGWGAHSIDPGALRKMADAGVQIRWFRPLHRLKLWHFNHRTHRKVLIVDEQTGFTGGVGIADEWLGDARNEHEWRDTHFRLRGPAVDGLRAAFLDNWIETDPVLFEPDVDRFPVQPRLGSSVVQCVLGAAETGWSNIETLFRSLLCLAEKRVRITTAYFSLDPDVLEAFRSAARRGVEIEVLLPGPHADKRFVQLAGEALYDELLDEGVRIWHFQPSMLHAKVLTVDGMVASIGSANVNARSASLDEEVDLVVFDPDFVATLDRDFDEDLERSVRIEHGRWKQRPARQKAKEAVLGPLRRLV